MGSSRATPSPPSGRPATAAPPRTHDSTHRWPLLRQRRLSPRRLSPRLPAASQRLPSPPAAHDRRSPPHPSLDPPLAATQAATTQPTPALPSPPSVPPPRSSDPRPRHPLEPMTRPTAGRYSGSDDSHI